MKKIRKIGVSELSKYYELIDDILKRHLKGGSYYFDQNGNFLGNVGSDSSVRIVDESQWSLAQCYQIDGQGVLFSECTNHQTLANILASFLPTESYDSMNDNGAYHDVMAGYATNSSGYTQFVFDPNDSRWNDYYNMASTAEHESYHYYAGHVGYDISEEQLAQNEWSNILNQVSSPTYTQTTNGYKQTVANYLYAQWIKLEIADQPGYTQADAENACGL
jgi:hypothetical protein